MHDEHVPTPAMSLGCPMRPVGHELSPSGQRCMQKRRTEGVAACKSLLPMLLNTESGHLGREDTDKSVASEVAPQACRHRTYPGQIALTVMNRRARVDARRMVRWFAAALLVPSTRAGGGEGWLR